MTPADRVLSHFDQISEAPDAILCLRRFVRDLAVRGKLVEQRQSDELASELLKLIAVEKGQLVRAGRIRQQQVEQADVENVPFLVPRSTICLVFNDFYEFHDVSIL
jgi:type I restriction enzyme, S subunit